MDKNDYRKNTVLILYAHVFKISEFKPHHKTTIFWQFGFKNHENQVF